MTKHIQGSETSAVLRWGVILTIAAVALFGSYRFALASTASRTVAGTGTAVAAVGGNGSASAATVGSGCCGGTGASGSAAGCCGGRSSATPATAGAAKVSGGVQRISVDGSKGSYVPNTIGLKAGVPAEITFSNAGGCDGVVQSQDLGFAVDFTGGPQTVKLPSLRPGTYTFACSMNMVTGTIVVK